MRRLLAALLLVVMALTVLYAGAALGQTDPDLNDPDYWLGVFPGAVWCGKHEAGDETVHGEITDDGLAVVLNPHQPGWAGDRWAGLVIKAGTENAVYELPEAGVRYEGNGQKVSHWIVCKGTTTTTTSTSSTTSSSTTTTTSTSSTTTTATTVPSSTTSTTDPTTTSTQSTSTTTPSTTVTSTTVPPTLPYTGSTPGLLGVIAVILVLLGVLTAKSRTADDR